MSAEERPDGVDWAAIEVHFRAGVRSIREIAREFGVSDTAIRKRARECGWTRDHAAKVEAKAAEKVRTALVRSEVRNQTGDANREPPPAEAAQIEIEAEVSARIQIAHRADVTRARELATKLLAEVEAQTVSLELLMTLREFLADQTDAAAKKRVQLFTQMCSLGGRVANLKALAESLSRLIDLERRVYGISDGEANADGEYEAFLQAVRA